MYGAISSVSGQQGSLLLNKLSPITYFSRSPYSQSHPSPSSSVTEASIFSHIHQSRALQSVDIQTWLFNATSETFGKSLTTPNMYKAKKEASVHYFYDKWGKKRPEKMQWQVVYHLSAYESGVFAMISPWASFTCKWDWASTDSLSYITASVFWLGRAGILFSVLGENCLVIRP